MTPNQNCGENESPNRQHNRQTALRKARVSRDNQGKPIGVAVFLTATELKELGVDTATADAVTITVEDDSIQLDAVGGHLQVDPENEMQANQSTE